MDTSKLVVGQHVPLSDALPGAGTSGVVTEVTKWHVAVAVAARREGVDGQYLVLFDNDGNEVMFYDWIHARAAGWDVSMAIECPIPGLKIIAC